MDFLQGFDFLSKGGWVAWVLAFSSLCLWYAIGYRFLFLKSDLLHKAPESLVEASSVNQQDLIGTLVTRVQSRVEQGGVRDEGFFQLEIKRFTSQVSSHRQTIRAIVMVAPLMGLLGTVIGMIETFDSLQDAALFSQNGGIAGGISQALITTQMGLVVAVPGLLVGKKLENREKELVTFVERYLGAIELRGGRS